MKRKVCSFKIKVCRLQITVWNFRNKFLEKETDRQIYWRLHFLSYVNLNLNFIIFQDEVFITESETQSGIESECEVPFGMVWLQKAKIQSQIECETESGTESGTESQIQSHINSESETESETGTNFCVA